MRCSFNGDNGSYQWGYNPIVDAWATGLISGQKAPTTGNGGSGNSMTVAGLGALSVSLDTLSAYKIVSPGETAELARLRFSASGENVALKTSSSSTKQSGIKYSERFS